MAGFRLAPYIHRLSDALLRAYGVEGGRLTLTTHVDELTLPLDSAIPCGLILNELLSNALKRAIPNEQRGEITLQLQVQSDEQVTLRVVDTGVGFSAELDIHESHSLGLQLVCELTEQLQGTIALDRHSGTAFTLSFPVPGIKVGPIPHTPL